jgi:hypothetical protein
LPAVGPLDTPQEFTQTRQSLRGGMKLRGYEIEFPNKTLRAWTYETPGGKLEQYQTAAQDQEPCGGGPPLIVSAPNSTRRAVYANRRCNTGIKAIPNSRMTWGTSQCPTASSIPL